MTVQTCVLLTASIITAGVVACWLILWAIVREICRTWRDRR
jgi:hypothetical protein